MYATIAIIRTRLSVHVQKRYVCDHGHRIGILTLMCVWQVVSELPQIVFLTQAFGILQTWGTDILSSTVGKILLLCNTTSALFLFEGSEYHDRL